MNKKVLNFIKNHLKFQKQIQVLILCNVRMKFNLIMC